MSNEVSTSPFHPSYYLPKNQQIVEEEKHQDDTLYSLTKIDQSTPVGKKEQKNGIQREKADKLMEVETQQNIGCNMKFLVGYDKGKTFLGIGLHRTSEKHTFSKDIRSTNCLEKIKRNRQ